MTDQVATGSVKQSLFLRKTKMYKASSIFKKKMLKITALRLHVFYVHFT